MNKLTLSKGVVKGGKRAQYVFIWLASPYLRCVWCPVTTKFYLRLSLGTMNNVLYCRECWVG